MDLRGPARVGCARVGRPLAGAPGRSSRGLGVGCAWRATSVTICERYDHDEEDCGCNGMRAYTRGCDSASCVLERWLHDGTCQTALNCARHHYDEGDCGSCEGGMVLGCDGVTCVPASDLGNGTCDDPLDCYRLGVDQDDCTNCGGTGGYVRTCDREQCAAPASLRDPVCEYAFDCSEFLYDGGGCAEHRL